MSSFAEALADHLSGQARRYKATDQILPSQIAHVDARWSAGEEGTDDYGDSYTHLPDMEVTVTLSDGLRVKADPGWCIENLMRSALGLELHP